MDYQILSSDNSSIINVDTTQGSAVVILPTPVAGFKVTIKDIGGMAGTNPIRVLRFLGTELIDNALTDTQIDENNMAISFETDGTNWTRMDSLHRNRITTTGRGIFAGGSTIAGDTNTQTTIDYIQISTVSSATSFGSLATASNSMAGCASSTRGLFGGGYIGSITNTIKYLTIATLGNSTSFANLTSAREFLAACSSQTIGVYAGGDNGSDLNTMDYVTIATLVNATSFGTLTVARTGLGGLASSTRGIYGGGYTGSTSNTIDYITIATASNATSFGTLTTARVNVASCSNSIRGIFAGGDTNGNSSNTAAMDYITIATIGNATTFGNLSAIKRELSGCASFVRGVFAGGGDGGAGSGDPNVFSVIDYVTIATISNSTSFGSLTQARKALAGLSSSHGGLNV